jgi:CO/xanthine dehydrogenase FAD-binding subunit
VRVARSRLTLARPRTLREALRRLAGEPLTPIAGCTDVYVGLQFGTETATSFLDLWGLDELRGIAAAGRGLRLGALATYRDLHRSRLVQARLPMLADAAREIGGAQIQNRGTLGGNIANASPAGDTLPVLLAAGAVVVLRSHTGERRVPFAAFYTGYRASVRRPDELIVAIEVPPVAGRQWWRKVGTRRAQAISKVMMAGVRGDEVRVALGAVAPTPRLALAASRALADGRPIAEAQAALDAEIAPIDDLRSTAGYRRTVSRHLLACFWSDTA